MQLGGSDNRCTMADGKSHGTPSPPLKVIRPEEEPGHVYLISCVHVSMGWCGEVPFPCEPEKKGNDVTRNQHV